MDFDKISRVAQLIQLSAFRAWCLSEETETSYRQNRWVSQADFSEQEVQIAKQIVLNLEFYQNSLSTQKKYRAWEDLAGRIRKENKIQKLSPVPLPPKKRFLGWKYTAAAVLILTLVSFLTIKFASLNSVNKLAQPPPVHVVSTAYGEQKIIQLDSGTQITLNANSSLTYRKGWVYKDAVKVKLKGEAYFSVAKRRAGPVFKVATSDGTVSVLGTRFVVSAWDGKTSVVLEEGSVSIETSSESGDKNPHVVLKPHEQALFGKGLKEIDIRPVNPRLFTSWTKGFFAFDRTPLPNAVERIEHIFGVDIVIADPTLLTRKISGSVESKSAEMVVTGIAKTLQLSVEFTENKIILRNLFPLNITSSLTNPESS